MKLVVQVKLLPSPEQAAALKATLRACNDAANWVSAVAFGMISRRNYDVRKRTYRHLRAAGIGSQAAQHVIKKVCHAYATLKANIRARNLGEPGSRRRAKAESEPVTFRPDAAQPYDQRNLSFAFDARTVSLWTVTGRLKDVRFTGSPAQLEQLAGHPRGESDLIHRDGMWFLAVTIDVPDPDLREPGGWLGVDLGIVNIATTSDGKRMAGRGLNRYRRRQLALRRKLQAKGTSSAKRLLKRQRRREARFAADTNHCIAKTIVATAERTGRGIALEDLTGIRARVRLRKNQRSSLHSWAFSQLGRFIAYKATGRGAGRVRRPGLHQPAVLGVQLHRPEQPCRSSHVRMPRLRRDPACGHQWLPQHRPPGRCCAASGAAVIRPRTGLGTGSGRSLIRDSRSRERAASPALNGREADSG